MKSEQLRIERMAEAVKKIRRYLVGKSKVDLDSDELLYDGVLMEFVVIGEEAAKLSDETKDSHPDIAWHKMVGMRNRISHEYFHVDSQVIWDAAEVDLPILQEQLGKLL